MKYGNAVEPRESTVAIAVVLCCSSLKERSGVVELKLKTKSFIGFFSYCTSLIWVIKRFVGASLLFNNK